MRQIDERPERFPEGLNVLLGLKKPSQQQTYSVGTDQAILSDWLSLNDLDLDDVKNLAAKAQLCVKTIVHSEDMNVPTGLSADACWALCAQCFRAAYPDLNDACSQVAQDALKCLEPKATKHPYAFAYDRGRGRPPFVSMHYSDKPADLLVMAHEFGHAVQIVASWDAGTGQMPPIYRECCAFLSELAVLRSVGPQIPSLRAAHVRADAIYYGARLKALKAALDHPETVYQYGWNYPIARWAAKTLVEGLAFKHIVALYRAGPKAGRQFFQHIMAQTPLQVAT